MKRNLGKAVSGLFSPRLKAKEACDRFFNLLRRGPGDLVRLPGVIHTAAYSPTSGGKGVSLVLPFLLSSPESCVVVDFKGENANLTAAHRQKRFGHRVALLDPFQVVTREPDTFNPVDFISKDNPLAIDECNDLANALVVRTGEERERHWNDSAEAWISAMLATVVQYGQKDTRSLQMVRELLSHPQKLEMAVKLMCESDCWDGMLARMGGQLLHYVEKERASVLTTVSRHLRFLDTLAVAASTRSSSFDPAELRSGRMTIFLILPPEHMRAQSPALAVLDRFVFACGREGRSSAMIKTHFVLDEAASLGRLESIDEAIDKYRAYGIRLQFYYQSLGQLKKCFPEDEGRTLLSNCTQIFFGVNDNATADHVSVRLGDETIIVDSGGTSRGGSHTNTHAMHAQTSVSHSDNRSSNWQQQARRLLKPEEVMALHPRTAITFAPGVPPICTTLLRYYEESWFFSRPSWIRRCFNAIKTLAVSIAFCLISFGLAALLTLIAIDDFASQPAGSTNQYVPESFSIFERR